MRQRKEHKREFCLGSSKPSRPLAAFLHHTVGLVAQLKAGAEESTPQSGLARLQPASAGSDLSMQTPLPTHPSPSTLALLPREPELAEGSVQCILQLWVSSLLSGDAAVLSGAIFSELQAPPPLMPQGQCVIHPESPALLFLRTVH